MVTTDSKNVDTVRARQLWEAYQMQNDLSSQKGRVAAIDPASGHVWIGDSAIDIADRMKTEGIHVPVYLVRVGCDHFVRRG